MLYSVVDINKIRNQVRVAERGERKVRVATWNFSGISSQRKQKEVAVVLKKNNIEERRGRSGILGKGVLSQWSRAY